MGEIKSPDCKGQGTVVAKNASGVLAEVRDAPRQGATDNST